MNILECWLISAKTARCGEKRVLISQVQTIEKTIRSYVGKLVYSLGGITLHADPDDPFEMNITNENEMFLFLEFLPGPFRSKNPFEMGDPNLCAFKLLTENGEILFYFTKDPYKFLRCFADAPWMTNYLR